jgi:hypothetical protein
MTREELEHIIRASGNITNQYEFVILGSQSILGAIPNPPAFFTMSAEADIYPLADPELADQIDGAIGEGSDFHDTHGFYAQGVGPDTATLPDGWMDRVHRIQNANTDLRVGLCLGVVDLFLSKACKDPHIFDFLGLDDECQHRCAMRCRASRSSSPSLHSQALATRTRQGRLR